MKIGEFLYFAPGLAFADLDFDEDKLPQAFVKRIEGYYLTPAAELAGSGHGFAAGLLALCAIDALGRIEYPEKSVSDRFESYCLSRLKSFSNQLDAGLLYQAFRCGVVHEARAKDGAEISLESDSTVEPAPGGIRVNPKYLVGEVREALSNQICGISKNGVKKVEFKEYLLSLLSG